MLKKIALVILLTLIPVGMVRLDASLAGKKRFEAEYTQEEPLVVRMNVYDGAELTQYFIYEYDEKNRYKVIQNFEINPETKETELFERYDYSYRGGDACTIVDTTHYPLNLVLRSEYDTYGNLVYLEVPDEGHSGVSSETFDRTYFELRQSCDEYCYSGAGGNRKLLYHTTSKRNDRGDEVYRMTEYASGLVDTTQTELSYDTEGRITGKLVTGSSGGLLGQTVYTYGSGGQLISESGKNSYGTDGGLSDTMTDTAYEYDNGRLVRRTQKSFVPDAEPEYGIQVVEYIYGDD